MWSLLASFSFLHFLFRPSIMIMLDQLLHHYLGIPYPDLSAHVQELFI